MEALLSYTLANIVILILIIELIIIVICTAIIILLKILIKRKERRNRHVKDSLAKLITAEFLHGQPFRKFKVPMRLRGFKNMIETIESFNQRFTDPLWIQIKDYVIERYLLRRAKKYVYSRSWIKRQLAARCFLLNPGQAAEKDLSILLQDPKFLVRVVAAICITHTSYHKLFCAVIRKMSEETPLSRFSYRDALIQVNPEKFRWIEEYLKQEAKNPKLAAICLDLLSTRTSYNLLSLVLPFVYGQNKECRLLAIRVLKNIPTTETTEVLVHCLTDEEWEIRAEAIQGLANIYAIKVIHKIQPLINDPVWFVRLQAALALKKFGSPGIGILTNQNPTSTPLAYEISQYVLALPE